MVRIIIRTPKTRRAQRKRYVVITLKGIQFAKQWYAARRIPTRVTRLYQLLLGLIWMKGIMTIPAKQVNQKNSVVNRARVRGYVIIDEKPRRIPESIQHEIGVIIGKAPRWIYA